MTPKPGSGEFAAPNDCARTKAGDIVFDAVKSSD
jgi:hypothetical protein